VAALYEFTDQVHKTFDHTPTPTLSNPALQTDKRLQKIPLPATLIRWFASTQRRTRGSSRGRSIHTLKSNLTSRGFLKKQGSSTDTHLAHLEH
jgi:hypothetical protein